MPKTNKHQRKAARKANRTVRRTLSLKPVLRRCLHDAGSWIPLGHAAPAADLEPVAKAFGQPRFTEQEQQANPDKPYTRLIKDALKVGTWVVGQNRDGTPEKWDVGRTTLASIAQNFALGQSRGLAANLGKEHGDEKTGLIHPDDLLAPIDAVRVIGDTLWVACYVTPDDAKYLSNPARKVSVGVISPFIDGAGNQYADQLIHLAVTDSPVVMGQGPFLKLAQSAVRQEGNAMDNFDAFLSALNSLLESAGGSPLPDDTTADNITERIIGAAAAMGGNVETTETEEDTETPAGGELPEMDVAPEGLTMSKPNAIAKAITAALAPFGEQIKTLSAEVKSLKGDKANERKARHLSWRATAGAAGVPAVRLAKVDRIAEKCGYDEETLEPIREAIEEGFKISTKRLAKTLATGDTPIVPGAGGRLSDEEKAKELEAEGIKPMFRREHRLANRLNANAK